MEIDRVRLELIFTRYRDVNVLYRYVLAKDLSDGDLQELVLEIIEKYLWEHLLNLDYVILEEDAEVTLHIRR